MMIEFDTEHNIPDLHDINLTQQHPCGIKHRQHGRMTTTDLMYDLSQLHIWCHTQIVSLDNRFQIHQRQHRMVGMVGNQLPLTSQTGAVDTMRLKNDNREISTHADNHQWHEHRIATRQFCNQKDTRQRSMHHTRHHTSHTQQREVLLWHIDAYLVDIPKSGEKESCETSDKQRGGKRTTTTATTIRG